MSDEENLEVKRRKVIVDDDEEDEIAVDAKEEAIDDLFGDEDEEEVNEGNEVDEKVDEVEEDDGFKFDVEKSPEPKELKVGNEDIVRHPPKFNSVEKEEIYDAKIPKFFKINPVRFDGNDYLQTLNKEFNLSTSEEQEKNSLQRLIDENTIRWRFTKQQSSQTLTAESNAQIVEWEDGSLSLKLGDEIFDVISTNIKDTYLTTENSTQDNNNDKLIHLVDGSVSKTIKFVPTSTNSKIHKRLTSALQSRQQGNKPGAQSVFVEVDPEKEARRLEKLVEDQIREKRRQALKLEKEQERLGSVGASVSSAGTRYERESYEDGYEDEEDGFIDDEEGEDEEEEDEDEEEATERLKQIKEDGAEQYDTARKKRRVISDDEDE